MKFVSERPSTYGNTMSTNAPPEVVVDLICSVLNGARFLGDLLDSLQGQSHRAWRLWVRDDGSTDETVAILERAAASDPRVRVLHVGGPRLGIAPAYGWVLERLPSDALYIMSADADDVWLPRKIEVTLGAMRRAEAEYGDSMPILVHTDLTVTDGSLNPIDASFWAFAGIEPEPPTLRRLIVRNVATSPSLMFNRSLKEKIGATPREAIAQDWWYTLVAAATGRVIALREATVLYRQHGANDAGASRHEPPTSRNVLRLVREGIARTRKFRQDVARTAAQARALLDRYASELSPDDRAFLADYSRIPELPLLKRKLEVLRLRALPEHDLVRTVGAVLRA